MNAAPRVPLILMRVGGIMVAAGIALAYLAWALSYSQVNLAAIAIRSAWCCWAACCCS